MAVTPQSIVRSPMLLMALLVSSGIAIFGVSLFFGSCSAKKTVKKPCKIVKVERQPVETVDAGVCSPLVADLPADVTQWSEANWVSLTVCLDNADESHEVVRIADRGLNFYPHSETLYNVKAYHELELKRYDHAVTTLETGLRHVTPSNGVMENNLAWAALWEARRIDSLSARELYQSSLRRDANSCEAIHTGLWVEYAVAMKQTGRARTVAVQNYENLRGQYNRCINRIDYGDEKTLYEVLGAGVLDHEMAKLTVLRELETGVINTRAPRDAQLVERAMTEHNERFKNLDVNDLCAEASPVRSAAHRCRGLVRSELFNVKTVPQPRPQIRVIY